MPVTKCIEIGLEKLECQNLAIPCCSRNPRRALTILKFIHVIYERLKHFIRRSGIMIKYILLSSSDCFLNYI